VRKKKEEVPIRTQTYIPPMTAEDVGAVRKVRRRTPHLSVLLDEQTQCDLERLTVRLSRATRGLVRKADVVRWAIRAAVFAPMEEEMTCEPPKRSEKRSK
jgi:hypothetical protein